MAANPQRQTPSETTITAKNDPEIERLEKELLKVSGELASTSAKLQNLFDQHNAVVNEKKKLEILLENLLASQSWKLTAPLRYVLKIGRTVHPLFRFGTIKTTPSQLHDVNKANDGSLQVAGATPYLVFEPTGHLPEGWCLFTFTITQPIYFHLSYDEGNGFTDTNKHFISLDNRQPWVVQKIPQGAVKVRIDFFETGSAFRLDGLRIRPLGKIQLLTKLFIQKLGPSPKYWLPKISKALAIFKKGGLAAVRAKMIGDEHTNNYQEWVEKYDTLTAQDHELIKQHLTTLNFQPKISVVLPVYNTPEEWLRKAIDSVRTQLYTNWELCIADDASPSPHVRTILQEYAAKDNRIKITFRAENGHISESSNSALALATGEYVALLDHDDELREHALYMNVAELNRYPNAKLIFSDEDKITTYGMRFNPYFKSDWSREFFLQQNFVCHLSVFKREVLTSVGGFRKGFEGSQDWDLVLRVVDAIDEKDIRHIPHILYHWRSVEGSTAQSSAFKPYALQAGAKAVEEHLQRRGTKGRVEILEDIAHYRIRYDLPRELPLVSIIIPTKDKLGMLSRCVSSLLEKTTYKNFEIIIIDNGSVEDTTLRYFDSISRLGNVRVIHDERSFNFSRLNNFAVTHAKGSLLAFLNNDLEVISPDWLSEMVSYSVQPHNGAIGARLWYPNGLLQHGGVILGIGGVAGHNHKGRPRSDVGYFNRAILAQNLSAVTAACLVIRREIFDAVGGFDEENLSIAFNDVDFCIKVREQGFKNVWTPYAELYHYESVSRGYEHTPEKFERFERETRAMKQRWGNALNVDPYYNPNLTIQSEDFKFAFPPRITKPWMV